jgi:hypothetical protein
MFGRQTVGVEFEDIHVADFEGFAVGFHAHEIVLESAAYVHPAHHPVAFGEHLPRLDFEIRESRHEVHHVLFQGFAPFGFGYGGVVNVVFSDQLDKFIELASVDKFIGFEYGGFVSGGSFGGFFQGIGSRVGRGRLLASGEREKGQDWKKDSDFHCFEKKLWLEKFCLSAQKSARRVSSRQSKTCPVFVQQGRFLFKIAFQTRKNF